MKTELKALAMRLRKNRDSIARLIVFHLSEVEKIGKNKDNRETTEEEAVQYVKKTVQKLKEDQFANDETQREIELLASLLPQMASREEVEEFIRTEGLNLSNKGEVMRAVKAEFGAAVDMRMVAGML
jgi:uncharacterized protein YqeY